MSTRNIFAYLIISLAAILCTGCDEDETTNPPPVNDTSTVNFNDLIIAERTLPFDEALSAVDLYKGIILRDSSRNKDANLIDSLFAADSVFYFRSGELSDEPYAVPGYQTRFKFVYLNLTQTQFDTVKVIPDTDTSLTENDFTSDNTESFRAPLAFNTVYGFYLKGKYDNSIVPYRVFGLIYLDFAYYDAQGFKLRFDVKINKAGRNSFKSQ